MSSENPNQVKYGCFIVIPLKYDPRSFKQSELEKIAEYKPLVTMDLNENIKIMLDRCNDAAVGSCYSIKYSQLISNLCIPNEMSGSQGFFVSNLQGNYSFDLISAYLYVFHTQVAFLCLGISFEQIKALQAICNPGFADNEASFCWVDSSGKKHIFSVEKWLSDFLTPLGLHNFFDKSPSYLLDAYNYIFAVVPNRFNTLEEMQKITFNLHKMMPIDTPVEDDAEEDIRYVYAAKNQMANSYRWGCCVTSQTISYVIADEAMNLEDERKAQAEDGLPVVLLSLYEKYTCLRFTELITHMEKKQLKQLKDLMLKFQAFGTVTPANLSRWHNVKQIYAHLLQVNDIPSAVQDISAKISILTAHLEEIERTKSETVINIITVFGLVSILASVLSIVQILSGGDTLIWASTILTTVMLVLITAVAVWNRKK